MRLKPALSPLIAFSGASGAPAPPPQLTACYYERVPFFGDHDGKAQGLLIDISRLILDEAAIRYRFANVPAVRIFEALKKPSNACLLGALSLTPNRPEMLELNT